ncbi:MAG: metallophosphoesterase [Lachnospiraceae bacterium]|nr:metallophosphoesterase [Lachnospiraceae bacterium]
MMMWIMIMIALLCAFLAGCIYISTRIARLGIIRRAASGKKGVGFVMGFAILLLVTAAVYFTLGMMNTIICLLHLFVFWMLCDLAVYILLRKKDGRFREYYAALPAVLLTVLYLAAGWYMAHNVSVTYYTLETEKQVGSFRIIHFADSHIGTTFDGKGFYEQIKRMNELNPDVVVITGDYVDDDTTYGDMADACRALGELQTSGGVYFAFGNHDKGYYGSDYRGYGADELVEELAGNGVTVLEDDNVLIDERYYIIGRKDRSEEQHGSSRACMDELICDIDSDGKYTIVLDHQPHDYDAQEEAGVDLVLSGHTHGGQLFPFNYVGEWTKENEKTYGLETRGDTNYIVTSGISDWAIGFKTGCKSEFAVIDIKGRDSSFNPRLANKSGK